MVSEAARKRIFFIFITAGSLDATARKNGGGLTKYIYIEIQDPHLTIMI